MHPPHPPPIHSSLSISLDDVHDVVDGNVLSNQYLAVVYLVLGEHSSHLPQQYIDGMDGNGNIIDYESGTGRHLWDTQ